jgi:hypothetical protein
MGKWFSFGGSDNTHDSRTRSNDKRADDFTSKKGDGGNHCHLWVNKETKESGTEHRGACKVCDDKKK